MDVTTISNVSTNLAQLNTQNRNITAARFAYSSYTTAKKQDESGESTFSAAFELDISIEARRAQASQQGEIENIATQRKGLSAEELDQLQQEAEANEVTFLNSMIQALTEHNSRLQGWLDLGIGILNFDGTKIDAARFVLPEVATNQEEAAKAVAEGGAWSVDAVATRIFDLAMAIAGNDPEKREIMREAINEGFRQAGETFKSHTGLDEMPAITKETQAEIGRRFDELEELKEQTV